MRNVLKHTSDLCLRFVILMTDTRRVKRYIIIIIILILVMAQKFISQLLLSHWVQSVRRVALSFLNSVASLLISRTTTEKSAFYFSDSPY